jgi:hypothetical protein
VELAAQQRRPTNRRDALPRVLPQLPIFTRNWYNSFDRGFAKIWTATTLRRLPSHAANRHGVLLSLAEKKFLLP